MDVFSALADPTRRNILEVIATSGQLSASDISDKFKVSPPAISQHLKVLREAKLVQMERQAQRRLYQVNPEAIDEISDWAKKLKKVWEERFDRLDKVLKDHPPSPLRLRSGLQRTRGGEKLK